jgi:hypothetical protein
MFVEVNDVEKGCPVIINLDSVVEIAPLRSGGCEICFPDAAVGGRRVMKVTDEYTLFQQFVMQTVSAEDIAKVNGRIAGNKKEKAPVGDILSNIPKL